MFKGLSGLGDIGKLMSQAKQMQEKAAQMQASLDEIEVEGVSAAGMVRAVCTAKGRLVRLHVDPSLIAADEAGVIQDLIVAAVNDAQTKAAERAQAEMAKLTEGMPLPPGMDKLFG